MMNSNPICPALVLAMFCSRRLRVKSSLHTFLEGRKPFAPVIHLPFGAEQIWLGAIAQAPSEPIDLLLTFN